MKLMYIIVLVIICISHVTFISCDKPDPVGSLFFVDCENLKRGDYSPVWSPDGKKITFVSCVKDNYDIYAMNSDGSNIKRLTSNPGRDDHPSWSPNSKKIAFESDRDGDFQIFVMNADGSNVTNLSSK